MQTGVRLAMVVLSVSTGGCVYGIEGLNPRPNIPEVTSPPAAVLVLAEKVKQETKVEINANFTAQLETFRGDIKRGFLNGFPGAKQGDKGALQLSLTDVEPTFECLKNVGCVSLLRYRGALETGTGKQLVTFAGKARSELCPNKLDTCISTSIERMYEEIFKATKEMLIEGATPATTKPGATSI